MNSAQDLKFKPTTHFQTSTNFVCVWSSVCTQKALIFSVSTRFFVTICAGQGIFAKDLLDLFKILDTPLENRSTYLDDTLKKFPYVDGELFNGEIDFPNFKKEIRDLLLNEASSNFKNQCS